MAFQSVVQRMVHTGGSAACLASASLYVYSSTLYTTYIFISYAYRAWYVSQHTLLYMAFLVHGALVDLVPSVVAAAAETFGFCGGVVDRV